MAASILSLGMFTLRAFWRTRRRAGLLSGSGPPALTAMVMSLPMRANCLAILSQRANMVALRTSKMRPITSRASNVEYRMRAGEGGAAILPCGGAPSLLPEITDYEPDVLLALAEAP